MNNVDSKIMFYSLGSCRLDLSKIEEEKLDLSKKFVSSSKLNLAMKKVIAKDIELLNDKLNNFINEVKKYATIRNINLNIKDNYKIEDISVLIEELEKDISDLIVSKNKLKVGLFTSNKKEKKIQGQNIEECINYLSKYQVDIISIQNEYNKLSERKNILGPLDEVESEDIYEEDCYF